MHTERQFGPIEIPELYDDNFVSDELFDLSEPETYELDTETLRAFHRQQAIIAHFKEQYRDPILRSHQLDAMEGYRDLLVGSDETTRRYALLHAPGAGKTVWAATAAKAMGVGQVLEAEQPIRALFLGPEKRVLAQAAGNETVTKKGFALAAPDIVVSEFGSKTRDASGDVVTMTYDMFRQEMSKPEAERTIDFDLFDVVFYDECHSALGVETLPLIQELQRNKINIGMSGSHELEDGRTVLDTWPDVIHEIGLVEGIEGLGILNSLIIYTLKTGETLTATGDGDDYSAADLKPLMTNKIVTAYTIRLAQLFAAHNAKTVVFGFPGEDSKYARDLAELLAAQTVTDRATGEERPILAGAIGAFRKGAAFEEDNQDMFDAFDEDNLDVITSVKMGEVGWDPLRANCIILACPTRSARVMIQRIGRGLRLQDQPTIIIHFDYEIEGRASRAPKSPHEVLDKGSSQGTVISNPKDAEMLQLMPGLDISKDDLIEKQLKDYWRKSQERSHGQRGPREKRSQFASLLTDIISVVEDVAVQVKERRAYQRNKSPQAPPEHFDLGGVSKLSGVSTTQLIRLLRLSGHPAYSLINNDERHFFCTPEAMEFLDANVAHPDEQTLSDIATNFGCSNQVVTNVAKRLNVFDNRRSALRRDDTPKDHPTELLFFNKQDRLLIVRELYQSALPILPIETPITHIMEETGRSRQAVVNHLANRYKITPTSRRVGDTGRSGTLCMPTRFVETTIRELRDIEPLPDNHKEYYIIMNEVCNTTFAKNRGMNRQDVEDTIAEIGIPIRTFRRSGGHTSEFITRKNLARLKAHILDQPFEEAKLTAAQYSLPIQKVVEVAGALSIQQEGEARPVLVEAVKEIGTAQWSVIDEAIEATMKQLHIPVAKSSEGQQVRNAERILARIVMNAEPEMATIIKQDAVKKLRTRTKLDEAIKTYSNSRNPMVDESQSIEAAALELAIKPALLLRIMKASYTPKNGDVRVISVNGKTETQLTAPYRRGLAAYINSMRKNGMLGLG